MNAEQAVFLAEFMTGVWQGEHPATCKVLAAVPDDRRDYRPDPKSRTAWELALHLATADIWFLDSIIQGRFVWDETAAQQAASRFGAIADVVDFYRRELPARLARIRALPPGELTRPVAFFGRLTQPAVAYVALATNHSMHHRGQLSAYLRAMGSRVPAIYGMSADERA